MLASAAASAVVIVRRKVRRGRTVHASECRSQCSRDCKQVKAPARVVPERENTERENVERLHYQHATACRRAFARSRGGGWCDTAGRNDRPPPLCRFWMMVVVIQVVFVAIILGDCGCGCGSGCVCGYNSGWLRLRLRLQLRVWVWADHRRAAAGRGSLLRPRLIISSRRLRCSESRNSVRSWSFIRDSELVPSLLIPASDESSLLLSLMCSRCRLAMSARSLSMRNCCAASSAVNPCGTRRCSSSVQVGGCNT